MNTAPTNPARPWWRGWSDFWLAPKDPTTLGFIRIVTGLLVLYVYLAYSLDLQAFFGKNGWYAERFVNRERREAPIFVSPLDWDTPLATARLSDFPHRREALMEFLRKLPGPKGQRAAAMAYLNRADALANPDDFRRAVVYIQKMETQAERENHIVALEGGTVLDKATTAVYEQGTPEFFKLRDATDRLKIAAEIRDFWAVLPLDREVPSRTYVLSHFIEIPHEGRKALIKYMNDLSEDDAARAEQLEYLDYWNVDRAVAHRTGQNGFSVWFHVTDPTQMAAVHAGVILLIVLFTLGLFTRVVSVLVWVACVGYIHRTQQVLFGMDTMMNLLLFYLMIGDSGAALSLDRLIARYRAVRASLRRTGAVDANTRAFLACPPPSVGAGFALRLLQVHVCFIYTAAGLSKLKGAGWWSGQAFWDVAVNPEFTPLNYQWYQTMFRWIADKKWVYHALCSVSVWFTLFVEIAMPFLVWTKARWWILLLATAMHAAIGVMMGLNLFELMMIVMFLAFLPDRVIRDRFRGGPDLPKYAFAFNPADAAHARAAALASALDADNQVTLYPDKAAKSPVVLAGGVPAAGAAGVRMLAKGLRLFSVVSWVLWVPGVRAVLTRRLFPADAAKV